MKGLGCLLKVWARMSGRPSVPAPPVMQVTKAELARYLPEHPVIVEAGAHVGCDTEELARQWPDGLVYAFEPVPALFTELERRTCELPNVYRSRQALSDRNGRQIFHLSEGGSDGSSSLLMPDQHLEVHPDVRFERSIDVEAVTLDRWAQDQAVRRVDFLWLDMQGMEAAVLRASPKVLAQVRAVHTEVSLIPVYAGTVLYPEFRAWMEEQGFTVAREILPYPDMGNVLFVRR